MDFVKLLSVFMVLFAVIDIFGVLPILVDLKKKGNNIHPIKTTSVATIIMFLFLFAGEAILKIFHVDFSSFAVAGAIVLFFVAIEMILGLNLFKQEITSDATIVPVAFPLIAGPGSITTLISLRAEYSIFIISIALLINLLIVYIVLRLAIPIEKALGTSVNHVIKKFFGIILLAMAVKLFASNIEVLLN